VEQIHRQRDLIIQMDQHYQKQLEFLHSRIHRLGQSQVAPALSEPTMGLPPLKRPSNYCAPIPSNFPEALPKLDPF
jgi:hypothetical protein